MPDFKAIAIDMAESALAVDLNAEYVDAIAQFAPIADHNLLHAALRELRGAVKMGVPTNFIQRLHRVYYRRVAAMSRLFPVLHLLETSYRTFVCHMMAERYGTVNWWRQSYDYAKSLNTTSRLPKPASINGHSISADMSDALYQFASGLVADKEVAKLLEEEANQGGSVTDHKIIQYSNLKHLQSIVASDWAVSRNYFVGQETMTSTNFNEHFDSVRAARNSLFHHREIAINKKLSGHLHSLLDLIGVHLPSSYDNVLHQAGRSVAFEAQLESYHYGLQADRKTYTLTFNVGESDIEKELSGTCESEAVMNFMFSEKATRVEKLNSLTVKGPSTPAEPKGTN